MSDDIPQVLVSPELIGEEPLVMIAIPPPPGCPGRIVVGIPHRMVAEVVASILRCDEVACGMALKARLAIVQSLLNKPTQPEAQA